MNIPRYQFCEENTAHLLEFLKTAEEHKNSKYCNHNDYNQLQKLCPLPDELKLALQDYIKTDIIDITVTSDEDEVNVSDELELPEPAVDLNESAVDVTHLIKENLNTQKRLTKEVVKMLHSASNLEDIFKSLSENINHEEVVDFGLTLRAVVISNEAIVGLYVRYLLLDKVNKEYVQELEHVTRELSLRYPETIREEFVRHLQNPQVSKTFIQLITKLNEDFQMELLKKLLFSKQTLQPNDMSIIETLLNDRINFETLSKLIELSVASSDNYKTDKNFGKLLINVIKSSTRNLNHFRQPLENILAGHKSIWKTKIQKCFEETIENFDMSKSQMY